jgi:hypothetical protein
MASDSFIYDGGVFINGDTSSILRIILKKGIFYPQILAQAASRRLNTFAHPVEKRDKITSKINKLALSADTIVIVSFEEMKYLSNSPQIKRFSCWLAFKGFANPIIYLMELTDKHATPKTTDESFGKKAKITFLWRGRFII